MLNPFNRLIGDLLRGTMSRNAFQPWEVELLLDLDACQVPKKPCFGCPASIPEGRHQATREYCRSAHDTVALSGDQKSSRTGLRPRDGPECESSPPARCGWLPSRAGAPRAGCGRKGSPRCRRRSTGTAACRTIGPASRSSSTKWTVQPVIFTPCSSAWCCASRPGKAGSSEGWMFRMRCGNSRMKRGAQQAHEAGQAHQVDVMLAQFRDQHAVVDFAIQALGGKADGVQAALAGDLQAAGLRAIGDHHGDLGVERCRRRRCRRWLRNSIRGRRAGSRAASPVLHARAAALAPTTTCRCGTTARPVLRSTASRACAQRRAGTARIMPMPRLNVRR